MMRRDFEEFNNLQCEGNRSSESGGGSPFDDIFDRLCLIELDDIQIVGDRAHRYLVGTADDVMSESIDLVKENGKWRVC